MIDEYGLLETIQARIDRSTHLVFVNLPIWLHFVLVSERQTDWKQEKLKYPPDGMKSPPPTKHLFELMWKIHTELIPSKPEIARAAASGGCKLEIITTTEKLRELQFDPMKILQYHEHSAYG